MCGTFGAYSRALSFNGNKIITTSGGGALSLQLLKNKRNKTVSSMLHKQEKTRPITNIQKWAIIIE